MVLNLGIYFFSLFSMRKQKNESTHFGVNVNMCGLSQIGECHICRAAGELERMMEAHHTRTTLQILHRPYQSCVFDAVLGVCVFVHCIRDASECGAKEGIKQLAK